MILDIKAYMTAKIGTPTSHPTIPHIPPKNVIEKRTQKLESPVEFPRMAGPKIFPSNCCKTIINTRKISALTGVIKRSIAPIAPPIYGPKKGIILVTPTITEISKG